MNASADADAAMDGGPRAGSARTAWIAGTAIALVAAAIHWTTHRGELLHGLSDEALLVPLARHAHHKALYPTDHWLHLAGHVFSRAYSDGLGEILGDIDDPVIAVRVLAIPFRIMFLAATFILVRRAAGGRAAWIGTAVLTALPPVLAAAGGPAWPLGPGAALPRDLVFAFLPTLWIARAATDASSARTLRLWLYVGIGGLALLHPLTAIQVIAVFLVVEAWGRPTREALRRVAACGALALLGASVYVFQWYVLRFRVATPGEAPREVLQWRIGGIGVATPSVWMEAMEFALWLAAAALLVGRRRRTDATRSLRIALVAALALAALFPAFNAVVAGIQFDRLARVAVWCAVVVAAIDLPAAWAARDRRALGAAAACAVAGIFGHVAVRAVTAADRGVLEWIVRRVEVKAGVDAAAPPEIVPNRPRPGDPSLDPALAQHFRDLCAWARAETPQDAMFAVPPEDWGAFRAYACRGSVVTRKDGGFALSFLGGRGNDWLRMYRDAVGVYAARDADRWADWSGPLWFEYAVLDDVSLDGPPETPIPPGWQELRRFGPFRVLQTGVR